MGFVNSFCKIMDCELQETLNILMVNANIKIEMLRLKMEFEKPIRIRDNALIAKPTVKGMLLLNREIIQPENGNPNNELTGKTNSRVPNSASLNKYSAFIVGILDAQVEKLKPERKKKTPKKNLCL